MVEVAYYSDNEKVIDRLDQFEADSRLFWAGCNAIAADAGDGWEPMALRGFDAVMVGLRPQLDLAPSGPWRRAQRSHHDCWVPDKRSKAGKELAVRMDTLRVKDIRRYLIGMPDLIVAHGRWHNPAVYFDQVYPTIELDLEQARAGDLIRGVWITWSVDPESEDTGFSRTAKVDTDVWRRAKLSEFYTWKESQPDRTASTVAGEPS